MPHYLQKKSEIHNYNTRHCSSLHPAIDKLGYEPADLTVHPPPRTAEGGFIFFV